MTTSTAHKRRDLLGLSPEELSKLIEPLAPKRYNARQIFGWIYARGVFQFSSMHNLSKPLRNALAERFVVEIPDCLKFISSERARVSKYVLSLSDQNAIECVLIGMRDKNTFCVSTQVGCRFRCIFCATGRMGLKRNLSASEILGQILFLRSVSNGKSPIPGPRGSTSSEFERSWREDEGAPRETGSASGCSESAHTESGPTPSGSGGRTSNERSRSLSQEGPASCQNERAFNVVFMGMGEPLDNYENTVKAIRIMEHPDGLAVGGRRITVSSCGIPDKIRRLARENLGVGLALSLNATTDALRGKLVPAARGFRLKELMDAVRYFAEKSGRRVTLEYVLIAGVNDRPSDAKRLASIASSIPCKINLIELNSSPEIKLLRPSEEAVQRFIQLLYPRSPAVTLRKSRGGDIMAACGQLGAKTTRRRTATSRRQRRSP